MKHKPTVYLVCGQIGSGKTTFAKKLEKETDAIRFTPDEWLVRLYNELPPSNEFDKYYYRCCDMAWNVAVEILKRGLSVILDFGLWKKKERDSYKKKISDLGAKYKLYYLSTEENIIKQRLKQRNENPAFGEIVITAEMFKYFSPCFEIPSPEEEAEIV